MRVLPIAAESLGVRSMATLVIIGGTRLLIDPGAAQGEKRFGLSPSAAELTARTMAASQIVEAANRVDAVFITQYHADHCNLLLDALTSAPVFITVPTTPSQHEASRRLLRAVSCGDRAIAIADGARFKLGEAEIQCSPPLPHGKDASALGEVMAVTIRGDERTFVHASDLQGPISAVARDYVIEQMPDLLYVSGAPTYRLSLSACRREDEFTYDDLEQAVKNMLAIIRATGCRVMIDHHLTRDARYREHYREVFATGRASTVAEFRGLPQNLLEARRRELHALETIARIPSRVAVGALG